MKFELGQKQGFIPTRHLLPLSKSQNLIAGDKIWRKYENRIVEFEFIRYVSCQYAHIIDSGACKKCQGQAEIKLANRKLILCLGVTSKKSNIVKVIKKYLLPEELFEI